jgi:hypothetical protein
MSLAYLHALEGRLRVKVAAVKGSPQKASEVEQRLYRSDGIIQVTANPITGSVLILYDSQRLSQEAILSHLRTLGCFVEQPKVPTTPKKEEQDQPGFGQELMQTVVRSTMEFALQRLVFALI